MTWLELLNNIGERRAARAFRAIEATAKASGNVDPDVTLAPGETAQAEETKT